VKMEDENCVPRPEISKEKKNLKLKTKKKAKDEINERNEKAASLQDIDPTSVSTFFDIPLSERTLQGLQDSGFIKPTDIQKKVLFLL